MTLEEAYAITDKMTTADHRNPTKEQSEAKWIIYVNVLVPRYGDENGEVPPFMEPDFLEGWK